MYIGIVTKKRPSVCTMQAPALIKLLGMVALNGFMDGSLLKLTLIKCQETVVVVAAVLCGARWMNEWRLTFAKVVEVKEDYIKRHRRLNDKYNRYCINRGAQYTQ